MTDIHKLILDWGIESISSDFSNQEMQKNMSLFGMDSIDVIGLCEHLESNLNVRIDEDWVMSFETLHELAVKLEETVVTELAN